MKSTNKIDATIFVGAIVAIAVGFYVISSLIIPTPAAGQTSTVAGPAAKTASSTAISVTTGASVQLLATTTGKARIGAIIQPINCAAGSVLYLLAENDAAATAGQGIAIQASSSQQFGWYPSSIPVPQNGVRGITGVGNCTVLVTEFIAGV